jgi:hypothetical protein
MEANMWRTAFIKEHRTWEDWAGMGLGFLIGLTPWLGGHGGGDAVMLNAMAVGLLVLVLGAFEIVDLRRWQELAELAGGLWLIASPFALGYANAGPLRYWHFALGALVCGLALLELWQDWRLSSTELARHGK